MALEWVCAQGKARLRFGWLAIAAGLAALNLAPRVAPAQVSEAQTAKPAVVVSVASVDEVMKDVNFLAAAGGTPDLGVMVNIMSAPYTAGLDRSRPSGALGMIEGEELKIIGFLPVKNLKTFLKTFEEQIGAPVPAEGAAEGVLRVGKDPQFLYVRELTGWAFFAQDPSALATLPADPSVHLDGLQSKYGVAARLYVANIPEYMRKSAMSQLKAGYEAGLEEAKTRGLGSEEIDPQVQEQLAQSALEALNDFLEGADQVTIGWGVDRMGKNTFVELSMTAVAGSKLAAQMETVKEQPSAFAGFHQPDAAMSMHFVASVRPEDIEKQKASIVVMRAEAMKAIDEDPSLPNDEARAVAKDIAGSLIDAFQHTLEEGKLDGGVAVLLKPDALTFVGGGQVASGAEMEAIFKKAIKAAESDPKFPGVKYDALTHAGVRVHTMNFPIPAEEEEAIQLLGESLEAAVGVGEKSFYVAVGRNSINTLKKVIDDSAAGGSQSLPPMRLQIAARPILEFLAVLDGRPEITALTAVLDKAPEKDHVVVTASPVERGVSYRVTVEEGILQVLGQAAKMNGGAPGGF